MKKINRLGLGGFQSVEAISGLGLGSQPVRSKENNDEISLNKLISYRWCDSKGNNFSGGSLKYGNTDDVFLVINFKSISKKDYCKMEIINTKNNLPIQTETFLVNKEVHFIKVNVAKMFDYCDELVTTFKVRMKYNKDNYKHSNDVFLRNLEELKIHYVIFIPDIMDKLKWPNAARVQREWFNNIANNYPWDANPRLNFYDIDWALGFERFKKFFDENLNDWKSENSIKSLRDEIKKMIKNKFVDLPTATNKESKFGIYDNDNKLYYTTINPEELGKKDTPCPVPLFDLFYFSSMLTEDKKGYEESKFDPELDDFYGAIANTSIRIIASGILKYENNKVNVVVKRIGFYIRDGFDFVGDQKLGNWSKKKVSNNIAGSGININNESYRRYRKDVKMGQDFYVYSTIKYYDINNYTFQL